MITLLLVLMSVVCFGSVAWHESCRADELEEKLERVTESLRNARRRHIAKDGETWTDTWID